MKYLVMECRPAYAVVLSDDGKFIKVANMRYAVGQTVTDVVELSLPEAPPQPANVRSKRWISSLAAMAACLALIITSIFFVGQTPYASVYLTINPQVRIDVNRSDIVVGVEGINADGEALLAGYDYRKKDLDTVMDELVDRAIDMGYLHEGGKITLRLDADAEWVVSHSDHLNEQLSGYLTDRITVTIDVEQRQPQQQSETGPNKATEDPDDPDSYDDSDYGDGISDDGDRGYGTTQGSDSSYDDPSDPNGGDSPYEATQSGGDSAYDRSGNNDGQTDYGTSDYNTQSDYEASDDGQSPYEDPDDDDD